MKRRRSGIAAAGAAAAVLMAASACSDGAQTGQPTATTASASPPAPSSAAPSNTPGTPGPTTSAQPPSAAPSGEASAGPVPDYPGATVVSRHTGFTLLSSGDPVAKVGAFYIGTLAREGWRTISEYRGEWSVNVVARRGHEGVTVQVSPSGSGTSISVTSYPL